jgi:hypothetical protein
LRARTFTFTLPREHCFNDLVGYIGELVDAREQLRDARAHRAHDPELLSASVSLMLLDKDRAELFIKMSFGIEEWVVENTRVKIGEGIAGRWPPPANLAHLQYRGERGVLGAQRSAVRNHVAPVGAAARPMSWWASSTSTTRPAERPSTATI